MGLKEGALRKNGLPARKCGKVPDPSKAVKLPKGPQYRRGVRRPDIWISGPDEYKHSMYQPWLLAKAQVMYRVRQGLAEGDWALEFEEWYALWKDDWSNRGRQGHNMCITRKDFEKPWDADNCEVVERSEHLKRMGKYQREIREQMQTRLNIKYRKMKQYNEGKL